VIASVRATVDACGDVDVACLDTGAATTGGVGTLAVSPGSPVLDPCLDRGLR
jgi:hypothetical protein